MASLISIVDVVRYALFPSPRVADRFIFNRLVRCSYYSSQSESPSMGKITRFACTVLPVVCTVASLLCLVFIMTAQVKFHNQTPSTALGRDLYFLKVGDLMMIGALNNNLTGRYQQPHDCLSVRYERYPEVWHRSRYWLHLRCRWRFA